MHKALQKLTQKKTKNREELADLACSRCAPRARFPAHGATWSIQPSLSHLSSFTGGSAAGLSLKGTRTDNASNISLRTFLENNGGDINDILNDFGVGS